ncbi:hypothetical protein SAMN05421780_11048 [Flexibacter flexilis DSM 6793]|uniref:Uncharacterized protein n=1 Tax=Flexibacter flexilis DSM 6793 TaxID=927664 RepID=A0A1I1M6Q1_9BACT|nr:hypothetical protein [Flexibacter flexilis]SFC80905.1 hypothetical protein SAMN05421780_11048 [Flexibacter flexilis DSM 6793]
MLNLEEYVIPLTTLENDTVRISNTLPSDVSGVYSVALAAKNATQPYARGSVSLKIGGKEFLPREYPASLLVASPTVAPDARHKTIFGSKAGSPEIYTITSMSSIDIEYTDKANALVTYEATELYFVFKVLRNRS